MAKNKENRLAKKKPGVPTQRYLDISEIREDVVILKDGSLRAVIMTSSINFALKSQDEQQATIQSYMQFLNGIEYPIQIVVQSRKMNIDKYMMSLKEREETMDNQLLRAQIKDYQSFIHDLVDLGEIMQKQFYVVVPYDPVSDARQQSFYTRLQEALSPASLVKLSKKQFEERRRKLMQRVNIVKSGLMGMGLKSAMLDTQGLIELYYTTYNPEVYDTQKLVNTDDLRIEERF